MASKASRCVSQFSTSIIRAFCRATVGAALTGGIQAVVRDHKPVLIAVAEAIEPVDSPEKPA